MDVIGHLHAFPITGQSIGPRLQAGLLTDLSNLHFFHEIHRFVGRKIDRFQAGVLGNAMTVVGGVALSLLTLWILLQGYRIVTGRSQESMAALVVSTTRAMLIVFAATTFAAAGGDLGEGTLSRWLTDDVSNVITWLITGEHHSAVSLIDENLGNMQLALTSIDQLDAGGSAIVQDAKTRNLWFTGIGIGGPAITAGTMLLLNKIAMALFIGLGPLFILCLLFDQTRPLFQRWLMYGIGTLFSLAVMSAMVAISLKAVLAVTQAFWAGALLGANNEGISSLALQQGGLGVLLTMLIISAPPMAASFFQGLLGQFAGYSVFGGGGAGRNSRRSEGEAGGAHHAPPPDAEVGPVPFQFRMPRQGATQADEIRRPAADSRDPQRLDVSTDERLRDAVKQIVQANMATTDERASLLERYPDALASNTASAAENAPPPVDSALDGATYESAQLSVLDRIDRENLIVRSGQVTFDAEGNDIPGNPYYSRRLQWPGGASGVTLGRGYDMRHRSQAEVYADLTAAGIDAESAQNFSGGAGLSGDAARDFVRTHREEFGDISRLAQRRLFEDMVYPRYERAAQRQYELAATTVPGAVIWDQLDPRIRDMAVDLTYQQGSIWRRQMPHVLGDDPEAFARYIESTPELSRYEPGRHRANYLRRELQE